MYYDRTSVVIAGMSYDQILFAWPTSAGTASGLNGIRGTLDANLNFRLTPNVTLYAEGQNLTNKGRRELVGPGQAYLQESAEYGRTFWFGVAANF